MSLKRRAWLTVGAVVLGGAGVVTVAMANPSDGPAEPKGPEVRPAKVRSVAIDGGTARERQLPVTNTAAFSMVGIGWDGAAEVDGTAEVRTRAAGTGKWSPWRELEVSADGPDGRELAAADRATEPMWVGASDAVQVKVGSGRSGKALPKNLKLHMVDPGVSKAESRNPAEATPAPSGPENAAFAVEGTPTPTVSDTAAAPTDSATPADPATPSATETATGTPTETATATGTPTGTATATPTDTTAPAPVPTGTGAVEYSQDTTGIPGATEPDDRLGSSVSLTDLSGYSRADIAIGADGEDADNGTILQIDNTSTSGIKADTGLYYGVSALGSSTGIRIGLTPAP
ncbi:hypothetical protein ACIQ6K_18095 [Streptomyces sp. NPDC096354]|uniref:hypothetical protein n=1 Tax=Streptomyces sp. NPDC096354 TaxID=3366088 RepID=UPI00381627D9